MWIFAALQNFENYTAIDTVPLWTAIPLPTNALTKTAGGRHLAKEATAEEALPYNAFSQRNQHRYALNPIVSWRRFTGENGGGAGVRSAPTTRAMRDRQDDNKLQP